MRRNCDLCGDYFEKIGMEPYVLTYRESGEPVEEIVWLCIDCYDELHAYSE